MTCGLLVYDLRCALVVERGVVWLLIVFVAVIMLNYVNTLVGLGVLLLFAHYRWLLNVWWLFWLLLDCCGDIWVCLLSGSWFVALVSFLVLFVCVVFVMVDCLVYLLDDLFSVWLLVVIAYLDCCLSYCEDVVGSGKVGCLLCACGGYCFNVGLVICLLFDCLFVILFVWV